jgi:8-oxo-dGTP pyrophosphatase MutT (NUDIX family)
MREVNEETGLIHFKELVPGIFDLDIHTIPARNEFPRTPPLRCALCTRQQQTMRIDLVVSEESHDVKWIPLLDVAELCCNNASILRMLTKTNAI